MKYGALLILSLIFTLPAQTFAATSPFRACQGVLLLTEEERAKITVTPEVLTCEADQQVQILPEHGFFHAVARKLGAESQQSATQADFLKKVGDRAALHVARNNAITEVVIHCAKKDSAWFESKKGQGEIYDESVCPKLLASMRKVVREMGPKARVAKALMDSEKGELAHLKEKALNLAGYGIETERQELSASEKAEVAQEQAKTAALAKEAFEAFKKGVEDQFTAWDKHPVGPGPHPMMRKYAKSAARERAESDKVHASRLVEHSRAYGGFLQKAPVLAFLKKTDLEDNDADNLQLAEAAASVLANGKKDADHLAKLNAEMGKGGTEAFKRRVELLKYGNVVDEILRENPGDCRLAAAAADYVKQLDKAKQAIIYTGMAVSMLLPVAGPYLATMAPSLPIITAAASLSNVISAGLSVSYYVGVYDSLKELDRTQQRALGTIHTVEDELGAGVPVGDVAEFLDARDGLVTTMAFAALSAAQQTVTAVKSLNGLRIRYKNSKALAAALEAKGMPEADRLRLFRDLESGDKDRVAKASLELMKKLKIDNEEIRMMKLMLSRNMISDFDEAALSNVNRRLKSVPLKDRPELFSKINSVLDDVNPAIINNGNRTQAFNAALAGTRFGVNDPKRLAAVINEWGEGLEGLTRTYELAQQKLTSAAVRGITQPGERRQLAFALAVEELAAKSPGFQALSPAAQATFVARLKEGCAPR